MKDRAKREAFLVSDQESINAKDENLGSASEGEEEGSGKGGMFARLVSVESKEEEEEKEEGSGFADYLNDDPLLGNLSKRAINLSDLEAGDGLHWPLAFFLRNSFIAFTTLIRWAPTEEDARPSKSWGATALGPLHILVAANL